MTALKINNRTAIDSGLIHKLFEHQAALTPHAIAVCDDDNELTYEELDTITNQAANLLIERGVAVGDVVALCMERSAVMIVGLLAILKAGAAYLPLDHQQPLSRREYIIKDARVNKVFTQSNLEQSYGDKVSTILIEDTSSHSPETPKLKRALTPNDLVYVLYTSGTTGEPKGVEVCHKGLSNVITFRLSHMLNQHECAVFPVVASLGFDASAGQIFSPLCSGGKLIVSENLFALAESEYFDEITCIGSTPSVVTEFIEHFELPASLKALLLGGEAVEQDLCEKILRKTPVLKLINLYGPTETTVHSTFAVLFERQESHMQTRIKLPITIGSPIANTQVHILNQDMQQCALGEVGEIYISGSGLARGYRDKPALTSEKFKTITCEGVQFRAYATGDMGSKLENGQIKFLGRNDRQIKLRGNRIELDEIESCILGLPMVKLCAVDIVESGEDKNIVAYLVFESTDRTSEQQRGLQQLLRQKLPMYMLPQQFVTLEKLPLTPNGKIDRRLLNNSAHTL